VRFAQPDEQREYVKKWLVEDAGLPLAAERLEISFYSARYHDEYHSIFPMGDISALIPDDEADVCVVRDTPGPMSHVPCPRSPRLSGRCLSVCLS